MSRVLVEHKAEVGWGMQVSLTGVFVQIRMTFLAEEMHDIQLPPFSVAIAVTGAIFLAVATLGTQT